MQRYWLLVQVDLVALFFSILLQQGVGTIGVIDDDLVDISNLQRQVLHRTEDVGRMKVDSAKEQLLALDPNLNIVEYKERLSPENALELFKGWDVVVDGTDNIPTRYLIDDACHLLSIPWVYGCLLYTSDAADD